MLEDDREQALERCEPNEYPNVPRWEELNLFVKPSGLKPPRDKVAPLDFCKWCDADPAFVKDFPYAYKHGLAIAVMIHSANDSVVDSFVRFHWLTGWNHIFMYFTDPKDQCIGHAKALEKFASAEEQKGIGLSVIKMDDEWWDQVRSKSRYYQRREEDQVYEDVCKHADGHGDVESRRLIVADMAIQEAHKMEMDWFVSLDIEECVYVPKALGNSARCYFGSKGHTVELVRLWNHEAVPERQDLHDWFRDSTLFQVSRFHCQGFKPPREYDEILRRREGGEVEPTTLTSETRWRHDVMVKICECRQSVTEHLNLELPALFANGEQTLEFPGQAAYASDAEGHEKQRPKETLYGFQAYTHGKCAVRIMSTHFPPPVPWPGHTFLKDNGSLIRETFQANGDGAAVILHYPNPSALPIGGESTTG
ncbi:unnamed protein product [Prorocentrum cordatum]|uniref:Glycosyltransferase family 92 protein n=1 Tax=Prorocentrum cordatum TaxID=2364126 RepID=A0ABN9RFU6_9DINO|nr:unnamed protein product [Polarella glacialis]